MVYRSVHGITDWVGATTDVALKKLQPLLGAAEPDSPASRQREAVLAALNGVMGDRLAASGIRRVELSVEADNPRAIAFYQRFGFVHEGTQRAAYKRAGEDGYVDELMYGLLLEA